MRRAAAILVVLALMGGFAFGVNRFFASHRAVLPAAVAAPTKSRPAFVLPGILFLAQQGSIYRLQDGTFTALRLPASGTWLQPSPVPGTQDLLAVLRQPASSDVYLIDENGDVLRQLSHNSTRSGVIQLNHWMFWPHVAADGQTVYVGYDDVVNPFIDPTITYAVQFAIWRGTLSGQIAERQWTVPFLYTGGDVFPNPLPDGDLLYSKYQLSNEQLFSQLALQVQEQAQPLYLTSASQDCGEPAVSPGGTQVAMICSGSSPSQQSASLDVATLTGTTLSPPRVLVPDCLCAVPQWAPDGSGLVYYAPSDASGHFQLWWIAGAAAATPKPPKPVTTGLDFDATSPPAWVGG